MADLSDADVGFGNRRGCEAPWIQTYDGKQWWPEKPNSDTIDPVTIAIVLSRLPRCGGHTKFNYSVAQHSIAVCRLIDEPELRLPALLHDAHEAYTGFGDVPSPIKQRFPEIKLIEVAIDIAVAERFGFSPNLFLHPDICRADLVVLATEKKFTMGPEPAPWPVNLPEPLPGLGLTSDAREVFLQMMEEFGAYSPDSIRRSSS